MKGLEPWKESSPPAGARGSGANRVDGSGERIASVDEGDGFERINRGGERAVRVGAVDPATAVKMSDCEARVVRALTIAGSDSGGGAGIQGDLKTFQELGAYGMSVVTAVTAQNSLGVQRAEPVASSLIAAQLDSVLGDIGADAAKIGMVPTPEAAETIAAALERYGVRRLVVDPVRMAKDGYALSGAGAFEAAARRLMPLAELATPNIPEAVALLGVREAVIAASLEARIEAARALLAWGSQYVLLKGGHAEEGDACTDILVAAADVGAAPLLLSGPRLPGQGAHGTGCAFAAAACAAMAVGDDVPAACRKAKTFVSGALAASFPLGAGFASLKHAAWRVRR